MKVYWSNRAERLVEALSQVLREPLDDPLQPELIAVHSDGVASWLMKELSRRLGICAGVRFLQPSELINEATAAVLGNDVADLKRWSVDQLRWEVLDLLPSLIDRPEFGRLAAYVRDDPTLKGERAFDLSQWVAETFHRYLIFRQPMIRDWCRGEDAGWQSELLRTLRARIGTPHHAELSSALIERCRETHLDLTSHFPRRISLFGVTTLAPSTMRALSALDGHVDVHLLISSPMKRPIISAKRVESEDSGAQHTAGAHADDECVDDTPLRSETGLDGISPYLVSMGRSFCELSILLRQHLHGDSSLIDLASDPISALESATMLKALQADIFHGRFHGDTDGPGPWPLDRRDRSISIHSCHGAMRQVEVLRDQLLALFDELRDLQPRDIVVMAPDIEAYAPLIRAVFDERHGTSQFIPFRIADVSARRRSQVIEALLRIIDISATRMTAPDVLELLALEPVRTSFEIASEDMEQIIEWVSETNIRWGIDAAHRARHGQPPYAENTWQSGLDRLLLGYAAPGQGTWMFHGVLPYDEVEGGTGVLLGKFVDFCHTLFRACRALEQGPKLLVEWTALLTALLSELVSSSGTTSWEHELLRTTLRGLVDDAAAVGFERAIELEAVRAFLVERVSRADEASGYVTGHLTFCGMVPLRCVPARVVCLLGMDDGSFPRSTSLPSFDLTLRNPRVGDRSERDDDRQLFLDALLSARDRVLIFTSGRSVRNNQVLPPSSVVSELIDVLASSFTTTDVDGADSHDEWEARRDAMLNRLVVQHPLQTFSPRNYGAGRDERLFTFNEEYLSGARALLMARHGPMPFINGALAPLAEQTVNLATVIEFFEQPLRVLLDRRLGVRFFSEDVNIDDREPLELNALERYKLAQPLLERQVRGEDAKRALAVMRASGVLPWGTPGRCVFDDIVRAVVPVARAVLRLRAGGQQLEPLSVDLSFGDLRLIGRVDSIWSQGYITYRFAKAKAKHLLQAWIRHLVLACQRKERAQSSFFVCRTSDDQGARSYEFAPPSDPREHLETLLLLYRSGLTTPLLFFPETSKAYADAVFSGGDGDDRDVERRALEAARYAWLGRGRAGGPSGEGEDLALRRIFGARLPYDSDVRIPGVDEAEATFRDVAMTIFGPLLDHLREVT